MGKARKLDKRRKSIKNIRKITRTMELIATARFQQAIQRATAVSAYADRIHALVVELERAGTELSHPLLAPREATRSAALLVLTANRGMCGGYNASVLRNSMPRYHELKEQYDRLSVEVSGKRGISALRFRGFKLDHAYQQFEDKPQFAEVHELATRYLAAYADRVIDRLDVSYTKFISHARQEAVIETLLPLGDLGATKPKGVRKGPWKPARVRGGFLEGRQIQYEFLPSAESILEELIPQSFKIRLFRCFLDAAVSEQIARMVAMKSATDNADQMIKQLSMTYNRARQTQITNEIMEVLGGAEALKK